MNNGNRPPMINQQFNNNKAKNLKKAILRIIKELKEYKKIIYVAFVLAFFSSILAIFTPNMLRDLVDEINKGLIVNKANLDELSNKIQINYQNQQIEDIIIDDIVISIEEQNKFLMITKDFDQNLEKEELVKMFELLPENIYKLIKPNIDFKIINKIAITLTIFYLSSSIFTYIQSISMVKVANRFANKLRNFVSIKINKLPLKYFDKHSIGDVLSRVTNDVDAVAQSMNNSTASLVSSSILFLGTIIMMFYTNWLLALTAIFSSVFGFVFMGIILKKSQKYFILKQKELGNLNGHIEEVYSGLNIVKAYNAQQIVNKKFNNYNNKVYKANRKSNFLSGLMMPMMGFVGNFGYVSVCIVGALLVINEQISFGVIVAFITYVRLFINPLSQIAQSMSQVQLAAAASERIFEFIDEDEMPKELNNKNNQEIKGKIEFKNVEFSYEGNEKPTIKNFSAIAKPGQKIAIVGPTGAGKTTLVNLLMKFYDFNSGDIIIDGISIKELSREKIHSLFTMVLQDTWLFNGTIMENIKYNNLHIKDEEVYEVCKYIGLDHFIKTLPENYNTIIMDNETISSGQKQLLTIARGMIEDAPLLILDEATSNVDTRTEELVQKAMDNLMQGRTSFIIAHRLSTIKNADLILVMKDGNIIEQGHHQELINKKGFYEKLYNSQFKM